MYGLWPFEYYLMHVYDISRIRSKTKIRKMIAQSMFCFHFKIDGLKLYSLPEWNWYWHKTVCLLIDNETNIASSFSTRFAAKRFSHFKLFIKLLNHKLKCVGLSMVHIHILIFDTHFQSCYKTSCHRLGCLLITV